MIRNEGIEEFGYWWFPESPDIRVPGYLQCSQYGKISLEVYGNLSGNHADPGAEHQVILGETRSGKGVCLAECIILNHSLALFGSPSLEVIARFLFVGIHVEQISDLAFTRADFQIQGMNEWVGISGIESDFDAKTQSTSIQFSPPKPYEVTVNKHMDLSIRYSWKARGFGKGSSAATVEQSTHFRLDFSQPKSYKEIIETVARVNNLLCLAIGSSVGLTSISFSTPEVKRKIGEAEVMENIEVYYESLPEGVRESNVSRFDMLFHFEAVKVHFGQVVDSWLNNHESLKPAFNLYFSLIKKDGLFLENRLLNLIQGLETLHRRSGKNSVLPENEHLARIARILNTVEGQDATWLNEKLAYSNEPNLRTRLKRLIKPYSDIFGNSKARNTFVNLAVDTRNYLTHFDASLEERAAKPKEMVSLINKLRTLFVLHFLSMIGFDHESIRNIYGESRILRIDDSK